MRGRLPDTILQNSIDLSSLSADAREEYEHIQRVSRRYISTIESDFKKSPEIKSTGVLDRLTATQLGELMRIVGEDMKEIVVRLESILCDVPSSLKRRVFGSIYWDEKTIDLFIKQWSEPVQLRADFYLLKAMAMYQVGDAMNQLSQDIRAENYLAIALRLLQKAFVCLREDAGIEQNSPVTQYWRYECLAARINLSLATLNLAKIKKSELLNPYDDDHFKVTRVHFYQAMNHLVVGIKMFPSNTFPVNSKQSFKELECCLFAEKITEYVACQLESLTEISEWIHHTTTLLLMAVNMTKQQIQRVYYLHWIARLHLDHALTIYMHPEAMIETVPEKNHHFYSLQEQAIAAVLYAEYSVKVARSTGSLKPRHLSHVIECYLMLSACVTSPQLIAWYRRLGAELTDSLTTLFPNHTPDDEHPQTASSIV